MIFNQNEPFTTKQDNKPIHETIIVRAPAVHLYQYPGNHTAPYHR